MRKYLLILGLLAFSPAVHAQNRAEVVDRQPIVDVAGVAVAGTPQPLKVVARPGADPVVFKPVATKPTALPTPAPTPVEPQTISQEAVLALQAAGLFKIALVLGTAVAWASFGLAATFLLLFAVKKLLKEHVLPEKYVALVTKIEGVLVLLAVAFGYVAGGGGILGAAVGLATGLGAALGGSLGKVSDWIEHAHKQTVGQK